MYKYKKILMSDLFITLLIILMMALTACGKKESNEFTTKESIVENSVAFDNINNTVGESKSSENDKVVTDKEIEYISQSESDFDKNLDNNNNNSGSGNNNTTPPENTPGDNSSESTENNNE